MKKRLAILLSAAIFVTMFAGCTGEGTQPEAPAAEDTPPAVSEDAAKDEAAKDEATPADKAIKVGVSLYARDQFISILESGIKAAADEAGVEIDVQDAQNDIQKQQDQINSFITQKCDVIIVNLVNTDVAEEIIRTVGDTPIVFVNRRPADEVLRPGKDAYCGSQEYEAGKMQAEWLAEYCKAEGKTELNYVLFQGQLGLENTQQRTDSVKAELEKAGIKLNKVFEDTAEWDRAKAMDKMQQILGTSKAFDVVICNNDEMALGAAEALSLANFTPYPPVCGIDATADALQAVKDGKMAMSVFQDASGQGKACIEKALQAANGTLTDPFGWVPFIPVTKDNVNEF